MTYSHYFSYIKSLLETKSYSIIITLFTGNDTDYYELSTYMLLKSVYSKPELFELAVKHFILEYTSELLDKRDLDKLYEYIKSHAYGEFLFAQKYILNQIDTKQDIFWTKQIYLQTYKVRLNEKVFIVKYQFGDANINPSTKIILLSRWFVVGLVDDIEYNIFNYYLNESENSLDEVIFYPWLSNEINVLKTFINHMEKNIIYGNYTKIIQDIPNVKLNYYNYDIWERKYFGSIKNYIAIK